MSVTPSEFATFQILANKDFVNMDKTFVEREESEEEDYLNVNIGAKEKEEEFSPFEDDDDDIHPNFVEVEEKKPIIKSISSCESSIHSKKSSIKYEKPSENLLNEINAEKEGLLAELKSLESQGLAKLMKPLTMNDSLEEIQFQYDRIQIEINANQVVEMAKSAIKMGSGMIEMGIKKAGIEAIDGYHNNLCKDMNKFNRPLNRLYKKYWRRGGLSPEMELGVIVFGSLAWTVVQNKMGSITSAFSGGGSTNETPSTTSQTKEVSKPPRMTSLNIPSTFDNDSSALNELKELKEKLLAKELELQNVKKEKLEEEETFKRKVIMSSPKSSKKKTAALNLDEDEDD